MNNKLKEDLKYGNQLENDKKELLEKKFGSLKKTKNIFDPLDFEGDNCFIELKSRRINKDRYNETLIGYNKIKKAKNCNKDCYFCFNFTDGLYYIKYEEGIGEKKQFLWGQNEGKSKLKDYYYIPVNKLIKV